MLAIREKLFCFFLLFYYYFYYSIIIILLFSIILYFSLSNFCISDLIERVGNLNGINRRDIRKGHRQMSGK